MREITLAKLYEHNNWANSRIIEACTALADDQLDARPLSSTPWSIRVALSHLVESQRGYLSLLTLPPEARGQAPLPFAALQEAAATSGDALLVLARDGAGERVPSRLRTTDGYLVEPWVVMVQVLNHATEHRRQINCMLRALGVTPPVLDGWTFGEGADALVRASK